MHVGNRQAAQAPPGASRWAIGAWDRAAIRRRLPRGPGVDRQCGGRPVYPASPSSSSDAGGTSRAGSTSAADRRLVRSRFGGQRRWMACHSPAGRRSGGPSGSLCGTVAMLVSGRTDRLALGLQPASVGSRQSRLSGAELDHQVSPTWDQGEASLAQLTEFMRATGRRCQHFVDRSHLAPQLPSGCRARRSPAR